MIDTVALLLADRSPSLRYRALLEVDGVAPDDPEVLALGGQLASSAEVAAALAGAGDHPIGMAFALCRLAFLGLHAGHPAVDDLAERIFSWQRSDGSWPGDAGWGGVEAKSWLPPEERYEWRPLQTALPLRGIATAGFATDPRAEAAFEWLLAHRLDDGTWVYGKGRPGGGVVGYRRMANSPGCRATTTGALACFAHHPERRRSAEARTALDVLLRRETREESTIGFEVTRLMGIEPARGFATFYGQFDLAFVLDIASRIGASVDDGRIADLVAFLQSKRGAYGLWDHPVHPHLSRWLTLDILASLKRLDSGDWQGDDLRLPFRAYPRRRRRY